MKKDRIKKLFLEELSNTPIKSAVCAKFKISRQTLYRWLKEDPEFKTAYDIALGEGIDNINDLAESKLIAAMNRGEAWAIKYWLESNKKNFAKPRPNNFLEKLSADEKVDGIEIKVYTKREDVEKDAQEKPDGGWQLEKPDTT